MPLVSLFGLRVRCALALPGTPLLDEGSADVSVHIGVRPPDSATWSESTDDAFHRSEHTPDSAPALIADRPGDQGVLRLRYAEGIRFHVSARGDEVWTDWRAPMTEADAVTFLLGPVMGSILRRRGVIALHASAVEIAGGAWAFVGPGGSGKSTIAAALGRSGHPLLTEDLLALRQAGTAWFAAPAYGGIRLWEDSAAIVVRGAMLPPLTPTWPKLQLDLARHGLPFASAAVPLRGLVVLDDYLEPGRAPRIEPMLPKDLLVEVIANVYANYVADPKELARELMPLHAIASAVPGWRLAPGAGAVGLEESCAVVESLVNR